MTWSKSPVMRRLEEMFDENGVLLQEHIPPARTGGGSWAAAVDEDELLLGCI